ncbi:NAD-dependent epimerase/dehydratase family protein [Pedobacter sp.]|uniref:NAD-dependent epimerase/dehydratase family protein n=1 Tax=Pedobacter sp. TaxID=1411316 RepID=UPI003D7FA111
MLQFDLAGIKPFLLKFEEGKKVYSDHFFECEVLIISIPPKKNTDQVAHFPGIIQQIADAATSHQIKNIIFISASSVYGEPKKTVTELSTLLPQTVSAQQIFKAENILSKNPNFSTTILRFSGLVGPGRHPGRFFAGKKNVPNGKAPVNLVHLQDCIDLTLQILKLNAFGYTFNAVTPHHPQKQEFYTAATKALQLEEPEFINELKEWKIISSIQVPKLLNYSYKITNWMEWLQENTPTL